MYFIVGLIAVAIATWGFSFVLSQIQANPKVLDVGGQSVYRQQIDRYAQFSKYQNIISKTDLPSSLELQENAKKSLIKQYALIDSAADMGMKIPHSFAQQATAFMPVFNTKDGFDSYMFNQFMNYSGLDENDLYDIVREQLLTSWSIAMIVSSQLMPDSLIEPFVAHESQQRDFSYISLPLADLLRDQLVDDNQLLQYYENNKSKYKSPKSYPFRYISFTQDTFAQELEPTDKDLKEFYVVQSERIAFPLSYKFESVDFIWSPGSTLSAFEQIELERIYAGDNTILDMLLSQIKSNYKIVFNDDSWYEAKELPNDLLQYYWTASDEDSNQWLESQDLNYRLWKRTGIGREGLPDYSPLKPILKKEWKEYNSRTKYNNATLKAASISTQSRLNDLADTLALPIKSSIYPSDEPQTSDLMHAVENSVHDHDVKPGNIHSAELVKDNWLVFELEEPIGPKQLSYTEAKQHVLVDWLQENVHSWLNHSTLKTLKDRYGLDEIKGIYRSTNPNNSVSKKLIDDLFEVDDSSLWHASTNGNYLSLFKLKATYASNDESIIEKEKKRFNDAWVVLESQAYLGALEESVYVYDVSNKSVLNEGK